MSPSIKYCVVPHCKNTETNAHEKLFFNVPKDPKIRKKWIKVMRRVNPLGPKTTAYCCEDHFDVEDDMENYIRYKLVGGLLKLKKGVVPHKFAWQKQSIKKPERSVLSKLKIARILSSSPSEYIDPTPKDVEEIYIADPIAKVEDNNIANDPLKDETRDENLSTTTKEISKRKHKKIQVNITNKRRSKGTETDNRYFHKGIKQNGVNKQNQLANKPKSFRTYMQKAALLCASREPEMLLGLPKQWFCCIQLLSESCKCSTRDVMVALKKIRAYQSDASLGLDFGIAGGSVERIFRKNIPKISSCMKSLVFCPESSEILVNLPMLFRMRYSNVKTIIDCLEIQIEKPTESVEQALTWSNDKSCNTIKYLISITPDGLINFISEGYGGRASDSEIFEDCGIVNMLPQNCAVMADRGFKNVSHILQQKECTLIRLPSASDEATPTNNEDLETKQNAALRIHVEKAIGRLRYSGFLMPHATVDLKYVDLLDYVMVTVCGIVNLHLTV